VISQFFKIKIDVLRRREIQRKKLEELKKKQVGSKLKPYLEGKEDFVQGVGFIDKNDLK
jgi:hypothetical protein